MYKRQLSVFPPFLSPNPRLNRGIGLETDENTERSRLEHDKEQFSK